MVFIQTMLTQLIFIHFKGTAIPSFFLKLFFFKIVPSLGVMISPRYFMATEGVVALFKVSIKYGETVKIMLCDSLCTLHPRANTFTLKIVNNIINTVNS